MTLFQVNMLVLHLKGEKTLKKKSWGVKIKFYKDDTHKNIYFRVFLEQKKLGEDDDIAPIKVFVHQV